MHSPLFVTRWLLLGGTVLSLTACDSEPTPLPYDESAQRAARAQCRYAERCEGPAGTYDTCYADTVKRYADVKPQLQAGPMGALSGCLQCLRVRAESFEASLDAQCQSPPDEAPIRSACGPAREACAGAP